LSTDRTRIKLTVAYDGYDFCGWAPQRGQRTVHSTLTKAVRQVSGEENEIAGASRTDSGAHARGQVCHFDTACPMPIENWVRALNDQLPPDVKAVKAERVRADFESRFWAKDRWYRYRIQVGVADPLRARFTHHHPLPLSAPLMHLAAQSLEGRHDFRSFSQELSREESAVRQLNSLRVSQVEDEVRIDIVGQAFVRGMMRRISGALLEIGKGRWPVEMTQELLQRTEPGSIDLPTVLPAYGLCLMRVRYGRHPRGHRLLKNDLPARAHNTGEDTS
jgi:tRNA pseudouridine38-40 synthase